MDPVEPDHPRAVIGYRNPRDDVPPPAPRPASPVVRGLAGGVAVLCLLLFLALAALFLSVVVSRGYASDTGRRMLACGALCILGAVASVAAAWHYLRRHRQP